MFILKVRIDSYHSLRQC